jgi:SAM-dependent methyltransferase
LKGFVPTPEAVVDLMVGKLFAGGPPAPEARVLDPGSGRGAFVAGILRWCAARNIAAPRITAVESDPHHAAYLRERYAGLPNVDILQHDFLAETSERFDYVIGNPPYVALTSLSESEKAGYRRAFGTASGRFDLYLLFFEQALRLLEPTGRLVFITPEKFLYVQTAAPLRALLSRARVEELHFLREDTFEDLVTYPLVTTLSRTDIGEATRVVTRQGVTRHVSLRAGAGSWLPSIGGAPKSEPAYTLSDVTARISCGVATGADSVFVARAGELAPALRAFAYPTLAGRDLAPDLPPPTQVMLLPYTRDGKLIPEDRLGALGDYLDAPGRREKLLTRTCVRYKPWYAFHETPPMRHLLRPKLLCKDIVAEPFFVREPDGLLIPRHSTYYIVPAETSQIDALHEFLNSDGALEWLRANCQRAANSYLRLQSHVLKRLPVPEELAVSLGASPLAFAELAA